MKLKRPLVSYLIQNYYYNSSNKKVNTHSATEEYRYFEWADQTADSSAIAYLKLFKTTRLNFKIDFDYTA